MTIFSSFDTCMMLLLNRMFHKGRLTTCSLYIFLSVGTYAAII